MALKSRKMAKNLFFDNCCILLYTLFFYAIPSFITKIDWEILYKQILSRTTSAVHCRETPLQWLFFFITNFCLDIHLTEQVFSCLFYLFWPFLFCCTPTTIVQVKTVIFQICQFYICCIKFSSHSIDMLTDTALQKFKTKICTLWKKAILRLSWLVAG